MRLTVVVLAVVGTGADQIFPDLQYRPIALSCVELVYFRSVVISSAMIPVYDVCMCSDVLHVLSWLQYAPCAYGR